MSNWHNNEIQFPRLITEIRAALGVKIFEEMIVDLASSMNLEPFEVATLFMRAEQIWEKFVAVGEQNEHQ